MRKCSSCGREPLKRCELGEMHYADGSSMVCPNWNKKLDEMAGMTPEEADFEEIVRSRFR